MSNIKMPDNFHACGKYYTIDMDAFMAFVSKSPQQEKPFTTNINQYYDKGTTDTGEPNKAKGESLEMQSKEVTETKMSCGDTFTNIRYSFALQLLNTLLAPISDGAGELLKEITFGQYLALNSLIKEGIIIEVEI